MTSKTTWGIHRQTVSQAQRQRNAERIRQQEELARAGQLRPLFINRAGERAPWPAHQTFQFSNVQENVPPPPAPRRGRPRKTQPIKET